MQKIDLKSAVSDELAVATLRYIDKKEKLHVKDITIKKIGKETRYFLELKSILEALKCLNHPCEIVVRPMQLPIKNALKLGWAKKWKSHSWKNARDRTVREPEAWEEVLEELEKHKYEVK